MDTTYNENDSAIASQSDGATAGTTPFGDAPVPSDGKADEQATARERALVKRFLREIRLDEQHHRAAFERMRTSMFVAEHGRTKDWPADQYVANITGRHINQSVATLYAKNPRATAKRRPTLDFQLWDENPQTLMMAQQVAASYQQAMMAAPPTVIDMTGQPIAPAKPPAVMEAEALIADFQQGMQRRDLLKRVGRTLEVLFDYVLKSQQPLDFKTAAKQWVRRAKTTGVGWAFMEFQRELGPDPAVVQQIDTAAQRLGLLRDLMEDIHEGNVSEEDSAEAAQLEAILQNLQNMPEIVLREGVILDFPPSTNVIPDRLTKKLVGLIGARHLTVKCMYTKEQVEGIFGVDLGKDYTEYVSDQGQPTVSQVDFKSEGGDGEKLVCVYKLFDKASGLVYLMCDGYDRLLRPAAPPTAQVPGFFPAYALTFNEVESEKQLFPPSDVELLASMQREFNHARQGMFENRDAARPRYVAAKGVLDEDDKKGIARLQPHEVLDVNLTSDTPIEKVIQRLPTGGVDPNLYETNQIFSDIQVVVGSSEAQLGGIARATATESAIAASAGASAATSNIDDLDMCLTRLTRDMGDVLMQEMSEEQVKKICGVGAVWPAEALPDIRKDLFLEIAAGSSGKPNQAAEIANFERLAPTLLQIPGVPPSWLAREGMRRLDDDLDLTEAYVEGMPAIMAMNRMQQTAGANGVDPAMAGGDNAPKQPQTQGSKPAFGSNQV